MTSSQTPLTQMSAVPTSNGDKVDADDLVLHLGQVNDVEDQVLQDLTFRLSGKVLDGGLCTPFDPGVSGNSRSRTFPRMEASDSLSRTLGMDFFIPFPFPN